MLIGEHANVEDDEEDAVANALTNYLHNRQFFNREPIADVSDS